MIRHKTYLDWFHFDRLLFNFCRFCNVCLCVHDHNGRGQVLSAHSPPPPHFRNITFFHRNIVFQKDFAEKRQPCLNWAETEPRIWTFSISVSLILSYLLNFVLSSFIGKQQSPVSPNCYFYSFCIYFLAKIAFLESFCTGNCMN